MNRQARMSKLSALSVIILIFVTLLNVTPCSSFGIFQMPTMPTMGGKGGTLVPGDTIAVVGASGNVGKLVALRLADTFKVNAITRNPSGVATFFEGKETIKLFQVDLLEESTAVLAPALEQASAIVICTGTTAFPTKAWSRTGETDIAGKVMSALLENSFKIKDAIASLDREGYNTPQNVDAKANEFVIKTWQKVAKVPKKRAIMLSSIGVQRRDSMPFPILNACGVLDAKSAGERVLRDVAQECGFSYTIVRPGQLFGGPYDNNYYLGTLFQLDKDAATQDVQLRRGDELVGDTLRSTLAEVTAQICETDSARDLDFAVINVKGGSPSLETIQSRLRTL